MHACMHIKRIMIHVEKRTNVDQCINTVVTKYLTNVMKFRVSSNVQVLN
jgi:hypothetical protein